MFNCLYDRIFTNSAQAKIFEDDWVQGLVVDQNGEAVIGASIFEKGAQNGTVTDVDGKFRLDVQSYEHTLEISYIGYTTQRIKPKREIICILYWLRILKQWMRLW